MFFNREKSQAFKGFETFWTDFRMSAKMFSFISIFILFLQLVFNIIYFIRIKEVYPDAKILFFTCLWASILKIIPILNNSDFFNISGHSVNSLQFLEAYRKLYFFYLDKLALGLVYSFFLWGLLPIIYSLFWFKSKRELTEKHLRGTILLDEKKYSKKIKRSESDIEINKKLFIPFECENRHFLVIGKPGSGKTQLLNRALEKITVRGNKTIVYDLKGDFIARFYNPKTDIIFNPIDLRSVGWCLFNDASDSLFSLESICNSLIPPSSSSSADPFWNNAARDVLYSCLLYCISKGLKTNADIHKITIEQTDELIKKFKEVEGCERGIRPLLESKTAASVLSTFSQYVKCFEYLKQCHGSFSIKNWISDENQTGKIFITNYTEISEVLKPILSLFIDIAVSRMLMLPENLNRRIFVFLDEFGTLQKLNNIPNLLKLSRSFGGSVWLGVQDIGQVEAIYGRELTKTIINSCANNFIYSVAEPQTAELLSRKIGENETKNINENYSYGVNDFRDGRSVNERDKLQKVVLPSDLMGLEDLHFYLKLAVIPEYTKGKLEYKNFKTISPSFEPVIFSIPQPALSEGITLEENFSKEITQQTISF